MQGKDDTQPMAASGHQSGRRLTRARWRGRRLLLTIIFTTSCTLAFTLVLFVRAIPRLNNDIGGIQVSIDHKGASQTVITTQLETVGELLSHLGLEAPQHGGLSHAPADPLLSGMVIRILPPRAVTIDISGKERQLQTALENPGDILASIGITVDETDRIWVNGALANVDALAAWTVPAQHIRIRRAARLTIIDDGVQSEDRDQCRHGRRCAI